MKKPKQPVRAKMLVNRLHGFVIIACTLCLSAYSASAEEPGTMHHVHITGQSLALGAGGGPPLSVFPSVNHQMYQGGVWRLHWDGFEPLREIHTETIASGLAETVNSLLEDEGDRPPHNMLMSMHARGGTEIAKLDFAGGDPYSVFHNSVLSMWAANILYEAQGKPYQPSALIWLQGTWDVLLETSADVYQQRLLRLQSDYQQRVSYATARQLKLPLFSLQENAISFDGESRGDIPIAQWQAGVESDDIHVVTPIYPFDYSDHFHLSNHGYRHMGAYFGKVYKQVVIDGHDWQPLMPESATVQGRRVLIDFHVPVPPLVLDTELVSDPGDYGFSLYDEEGRVPVKKLRTAGETQLLIVAARDFSGEVHIRYAYDGPDFFSYVDNQGGFLGARGNLRDSDPSIGFGLNASGEAYRLYNWSVVFSITATVSSKDCTKRSKACTANTVSP